MAAPSSPSLPPDPFDRLRSALATGRPRAGEGPSATPAAPAAVILITVLGLSGAALEDVLEAVGREARETPVTLVFLTDSLDFEPFRARRLGFEYLPDGGRRQRFAPDLDWQAYQRRRYRLLALKWRPRSLISFGTPPPPDCVAAIEGPG